MKNFLKRLKVVPFIVLSVAVFTILFSVFQEPALVLFYDRTLQSFTDKGNDELPEVNEGEIEVTVVPMGEGEVDINNATAKELDTLPQIGPVRAKAIVEQREKMNGFTTLEDIMCTNGIGEGVFEKLLPNIRIDSIQNN